MKLTNLQRRNLHALLVQRREGVSVWRTLFRQRVVLAAHIILVAGGGFYLGQGAGWPLAGAALIGISVGSYFRIVRITMTAQQVWPAFSEIIDWQKAEALLKIDDPKVDPGPTVE
jgi:hypothetical protein